MNRGSTRAAVILIVLASAAGGCARASPDKGPGTPSGTAVASRPPGIELDPALRAWLERYAPQADLDSVLVAGAAGDETIVVIGREASETERANFGHAAEMWIAVCDGRFRRAMEYLSYDFACLDRDPVCREVRPGGLGFAALRQQPGGRVFVIVAATRDRSIEVTTAEGKAHTVGVVPNGAIVEVATAEPYKTSIRAKMPDGRAYELMLPPFGVVTA